MNNVSRNNTHSANTYQTLFNVLLCTFREKPRRPRERLHTAMHERGYGILLQYRSCAFQRCHNAGVFHRDRVAAVVRRGSKRLD